VPTDRRIEPWPVVLGALLLAMIGASIAFYFVAAANPDPVVVDDAYRAGLRYNEAQRTRGRAALLGYELALETRSEGDGVNVTLRVRDRTGGSVLPEHARVRRERPAEGGHDDVFELEDGGGAFAGHVPLPLPGRWRLIAVARVEGETLERSFELRRP
jgi:nitrogen fixation protein FixH